MSKKNAREKGASQKTDATDGDEAVRPRGPLKRRPMRRTEKKLHVELVKLQEWLRHEGKKICIVFEGRDGAGKGGTIKAITERVSPRIFRVVALPAPTSGKNLNFMSNATFPISLQPARSSFSTGATTIEQASSGLWVSAPRSR